MAYTQNEKATGLELLTWAQLANGDIITVGDASDSGRLKGVLKSQIQAQFDAKEPLKGSDDNYVTDAQVLLINSALQTVSGIAVGGELSGTLPNPAILNSAVLSKVLTGLNVTGSTLAATDTIIEAFGKVQSQLNGVLGGAIYQGVWNASTNSPSLASATGTKGYYYVVSVAGSTNLDGVTDWKVGDWAIYNGTAWQKVDNTDAVSSVNGYIGAVNLTSADISEVTNLYFTTARVLATAITGFSAGAGVVAATDTIIEAINKIVGNIAAKQDTLVSGTNIKTINGSSVLGYGNLTISGGGGTSREVISATLSGTQTNYAISGVSTEIGITTELRVAFTSGSFIWQSLDTTSWEDGKHVTIVNNTVSDASGARFILFENQEGGTGTQFRYLFNGVPPIIMPGDHITFKLNTTDGFLDFVSSSCFGADAANSFSVYSDFVGGPAIASGGAANGIGSFTGIQVGGSCGFTSSFQTSPINPFGILDLSTHTSTTGSFFVGSANAAMMRGGMGCALFLARATATTALSDGTNTYTMILGFNDAHFGTPVDAVGWKYDQSAATVWRTSTISNSSETVNDQSGFTVSISTMPYLGIFCNGDWTNIEFFYSVDGQTWVIGNAHTTNIPTGTSRTFGIGAKIQKSAGTTARLMSLDLMGVRTMHIRA